jgi:hypothetical protein
MKKIDRITPWHAGIAIIGVVIVCASFTIDSLLGRVQSTVAGIIGVVFAAGSLIYAHFQVNPLPPDPSQSPPLPQSGYDKNKRRFWQSIGIFLIIGIVIVFFPLVRSLGNPQPPIASFMNWYQGPKVDGICTYLNSSYQDEVNKAGTGNICPGPLVTHTDFSVHLNILGDDCAGIAYDVENGDASYYDVIICPSLHSIAWKKRVSYNTPKLIGVADVSIVGGVDLHIMVKQNGTLITSVNGTQVLFTSTGANKIPVQTDTLGKPLPSGSLGVITVSLAGHNSASASFSNPDISDTMR